MIDEKVLVDILKDLNGICSELNQQNITTFKLLEGALERITVLEKTVADMKQITDLHVKLGGK